MKALTYLQLGQHGRLGNQMWQIASTLGMANRLGISVGFPHWEFEHYFNLPDYLFDVPAEATNLYPDYMQDLSYFSPSIESTVRAMFSPSDISLAIIDNEYAGVDFSSLVAVHVRRGDYLWLPNHHPVCPIDYFEVAISMLGSNNLFVCSDDLDWCKGHSIFKDALFGGISEVLDLLAMSLTGGQVISNSTFSWWSAFLASNYRIPDTVVYPTRWYGPEVDADYKLMIGDLPWTGIFEDSWGIG